MFQNARARGLAGLGAIVGVGLLIAGYLATAGLMWHAYANGPAIEQARCAVACSSVVPGTHG